MMKRREQMEREYKTAQRWGVAVLVAGILCIVVLILRCD